MALFLAPSPLGGKVGMGVKNITQALNPHPNPPPDRRRGLKTDK